MYFGDLFHIFFRKMYLKVHETCVARYFGFRSFYESLRYLLHAYLLTYLLTYVRTYVQVIFRRSHPTLKLIAQKKSKILQVNVSIIFFHFADIQKMTKLGPKSDFGTWKSKLIHQKVVLHYIRYFLRYRLETSLLHFQHFLN